jgi:hypothetical protein
MMITAHINGKGPFRFIFDTGAPTSLVSQRVAREAGVVDAKAATLLAAFLGGFGQKRIALLKVGELEAANVDAVVMDHPIVVAIGKTLDQPIEGILGMNIFGRYRMTIDYEKRTLAFLPGTFVPENLMDVMMHLLLPSIEDMQRVSTLAPGALFGMRVDKKAGDEAAGVSVEQVYAGSPAAKAGLRAGDRLLTLGGRWTDDVRDCYEAARHARPGHGVTAEVLRDGQRKQLSIEPAAGF